jgi:hypothetical protein
VYLQEAPSATHHAPPAIRRHQTTKKAPMTTKQPKKNKNKNKISVIF